MTDIREQIFLFGKVQIYYHSSLITQPKGNGQQARPKLNFCCLLCWVFQEEHLYAQCVCVQVHICACMCACIYMILRFKCEKSQIASWVWIVGPQLVPLFGEVRKQGGCWWTSSIVSFSSCVSSHFFLVGTCNKLHWQFLRPQMELQLCYLSHLMHGKQWAKIISSLKLLLSLAVFCHSNKKSSKLTCVTTHTLYTIYPHDP